VSTFTNRALSSYSTASCNYIMQQNALGYCKVYYKGRIIYPSPKILPIFPTAILILEETLLN
jgi:hypothetical protein